MCSVSDLSRLSGLRRPSCIMPGDRRRNGKAKRNKRKEQRKTEARHY